MSAPRVRFLTLKIFKQCLDDWLLRISSKGISALCRRLDSMTLKLSNNSKLCGQMLTGYHISPSLKQLSLKSQSNFNFHFISNANSSKTHNDKKNLQVPDTICSFIYELYNFKSHYKCLLADCRENFLSMISQHGPKEKNRACHNV